MKEYKCVIISKASQSIPTNVLIEKDIVFTVTEHNFRQAVNHYLLENMALSLLGDGKLQ